MKQIDEYFAVNEIFETHINNSKKIQMNLLHPSKTYFVDKAFHKLTMQQNYF